MTTEAVAAPDAAISNAWVSILPANIGELLTARGFTPDNVANHSHYAVEAIHGCGAGTVRMIVRAGFTFADLADDVLSCGVELLDLRLNTYIKLKVRGIELWSDFIEQMVDGCSLLSMGFTVREVAQIRSQLDEVGCGYAGDLYTERTLADIPFDDKVAAVLREHGADLALPLVRATVDKLLEWLGPEVAEQYGTDIWYAYWVVGYDSL